MSSPSLHPLLQLVPLRVDSAVKRLEAAIWRDFQPLEVLATLARPKQLSWKEARSRPLRPVRFGSAWGRLFDQRWCRITLPEKSAPGDWLVWKDQGEATMYFEGEPWFGFDVAHRHCRIPAGTREIWIEANCVQSAIWHPGAQGLSGQGSVFQGAWTCRRDEDAWKTFHDLKCLLDAARNLRTLENPSLPEISPGCQQPPVERHSPHYRRMLRLMDEAVSVLDEDGAKAAGQYLADVYRELRQNVPPLKCVLTGHAHIDLVWLWPERIGELKTVHTFATVNRLMDEYPEFRFAASQPAGYEAVKRRAPSLFAAVQNRLKSDRWQATGGMYVESDTLIACGEALLRSFLVGQDAFTQLRGSPSKLAWLPDVFGYSACLPQMMKLAGVDYFFTTKLTWNLVNRFPYSSFVWKGHDGSEVVAHVTQDSGYCTRAEASELQASSWGHQQGDIHPEYLLPTGYGDGGGGPTAGMCERARRMGSLPGLPAVTWGHPEEFFDRLAPLRNRLPVHQGECYFEGHRGTYTTHGNLKAAFRELERAMQVSEAVSCVTGKRWDRQNTWKRLIFSQFHDYIPGSSVWDVYLEGIPELKQLAEAERALAVRALGGKKRDGCLFNPHAVPVRKWVRDTASGEDVYVRLPALSGVAPSEATRASVSPVQIKGKTVSNGLTEFRLNSEGGIEELKFAETVVPLRGPAGQLMFYRDQPARFPAWDLDRQTLDLGRVCANRARISRFQDGVRAGFHVDRSVGKTSHVRLSFFLEPGSALLHVKAVLDWQDSQALLKIVFPTAYAGTQARFGVPSGSILRPQTGHGLGAEAMWEMPFSRWLAVFDDGERDGLFLITENKYGASVRDGAVGLSLVRSPLVAGCDGLSGAWPAGLSRIKPPSTHSDIGRQEIRFALGRHRADLAQETHPASLAETLFTDPIPYRGSAFSSPLAGIDDGGTLIPTWAVPGEKGTWVLRMQESSGQRGCAVIKAADGWSAGRCDVRGVADDPLGQEARVGFGPYQIVSIRFEKQK